MAKLPANQRDSRSALRRDVLEGRPGRCALSVGHPHEFLCLSLEGVHGASCGAEYCRTAVESLLQQVQQGAVAAVEVFLGSSDRATWSVIGQARVGSHRRDAVEIDPESLTGRPGVRSVTAPIS